MSKADAVEALEELGLRKYEARCFVALTQLSEGTATEISQVADVPQSRVYDVVDRLHRRGLVDVQESDPRRYAVVPVDVARERLRQEYRDHLETATAHLQDLEQRTVDEDGVWQVAGQRDVDNRTRTALEEATSEIYLLAGDGSVLSPSLLEWLGAARDRNVAVFVEVPSEADRRRVHNEVPTAEVAVSDFAFDSHVRVERPLGRLLLVDRVTVVLSALTTGLVPDQRTETGFWASERGHGLVGWFRYVLEWRLTRLEFVTDDGPHRCDATAECETCEE
ncbi:helix-turn-helix domain-containing protein [Natrinema sp. 1APR25-10V2]|uniref:TrmB family transcriptional regulator n=1 Tax=Natrinema sp. 1APR25-10V2 TaxID=2951081 RepID=UPI002876C0D1|nr:helix-turn-helix domain-containing protein [Natrinema sp. 1APR25-10V2]MDS0474925.1 TrmB family transcriptional regulator [Natrinema sp. 1APR25-10V2]